MKNKIKKIKDVSRWQDMAGPTEAHKKINSLLTLHFIDRYDVPEDECLSHALVLTALKGSQKTLQTQVKEYLSKQFASRFAAKIMTPVTNAVVDILIINQKNLN